MHIQDIFLNGLDYRLPLLSLFIVILASFATLHLAKRVAVSKGAAWSAWLSGGASAMGAGIWAMHYLGLKALGLSIPASYDVPVFLLSMLTAILASAVTLLVVSRKAIL